MAMTRTREAWINAASVLGLGFTRGEVPTRSTHKLDLEGSVDGFPATVRAKHTDKTQWTDFAIEVGDLPPGLRMGRRTLSRWSVLPKRGVKTGDPEWDRTMVVKAAEAGAAQAFLSPERRAAIRLAMGIKPRPRFRRSRIIITHQSIVKDPAVIVGTVQRLVDLAHALHLAPPAFPMAAAEQAVVRSRVWTVIGWVTVTALVMTWIFGYSSLDPLALFGLSAVLVVAAVVTFSQLRRG